MFLSMYQLPPSGGHSSPVLPCNNAFVSLSYSQNLSRPLPYFLAPKEAVLAPLCHLEAEGGKGVHGGSVKGGKDSFTPCASGSVHLRLLSSFLPTCCRHFRARHLASLPSLSPCILAQTSGTLSPLPPPPPLFLCLL